MQFLELVKTYIYAEINVNQSTLIEVNLIGITHNYTKSKDGDIPTAIVFLAPICFIIVGAAFLFIISQFLEITQNKKDIFNIDCMKECPCRRCKFFVDNNYIKCAVNPSIVLTKQAINCSEYQP
ncbi:hypothetical protein JYQ62_23945 [Nostoc sp. UHCC 0702]|nr:hypothetical protein JYQ62_23945 [Nostoc sp. UHCC 0702]